MVKPSLDQLGFEDILARSEEYIYKASEMASDICFVYFVDFDVLRNL